MTNKYTEIYPASIWFFKEKMPIKNKKKKGGFFMQKILMSIMLSVLIISATPVYSATFTNGGMENWTNGNLDNWTLDRPGGYITALAAIPDPDSHSGNYSANIRTSSAAGNGVTAGTWLMQGWSTDSGNWIEIPDGGATVNFSAYFKFPNGLDDGDSIKLTIMPRDENNQWTVPRYDSGMIINAGEGITYWNYSPQTTYYAGDGWYYTSTGDIFIEDDHIVATISWGIATGGIHSFLIDDVSLSITPKYAPIPDPPISTPEPSMIFLLFSGLIGLVGLRKRLA